MSEQLVFSITHDDLIALYWEHEKAKNGPHATRARIRTQFENMFLSGIAEAESTRQLRYEMLVALDELCDPISGRRVCPRTHNQRLQEAIRNAAAEEKKLQDAVRALTTVTA